MISLRDLLDRSKPEDYDTTPMGILDACWMARIESIAIDPRFPVLLDVGFMEICLYVAGKEFHPDAQALACASHVLASLYDILAPIPALHKHRWILAALSFPYQSAKPTFYVEFTTEYDGYMAFSFCEDTPGAWTFEGFAFNSFVPAQFALLAEWAIRTLEDADVTDPAFIALQEQVKTQSIPGDEFLLPVAGIYDRLAPHAPKSDLERVGAFLNTAVAHGWQP